MRILGLDTSGKVAAAALYDSEQACFLAQQTVYTKRTHSQVILPLVERILSDVGVTWEDLDGFVVAKGPGSYTGLRIGIAAGKAMAFAQKKPCLGISTLEGLAWQALSWNGYLCPVMAARQTLVYAGIYQSDTRQVQTVSPDGMLELATLEEQLDGLDAPVLLLGDGAALVSEKPGRFVASPALLLQNGTGICLAAAARQQWQDPEALLPEYLQPVKAEKDLQEKRKKQG